MLHSRAACALMLVGLATCALAEAPMPASYAKTLRPPEGALLEEADVTPPPPDEWKIRMPPEALEKALPTYALRVAYLVPSNRTAQSNAVGKLRYGVLEFVEWYRDQMERNGFGRKSYTVETEADGVTPKVHVVNGPNTDVYYNVDPWSRVAGACQTAGLSVWAPKQLWLIVYEGLIMNPDGSTSGGINGGASFGSGDDGGVGMTVGASMALLTAEDLVDDRPYDELILPGWGPYPMQYGVTSAWYDGSTMSSLSSVGRGILIHESHHGLGMPHDFRNDSNAEGNLMGNGFRGMRGWSYPERYAPDDTRLSYADALALNVHRLFNPAQTYSDGTKPTASVMTSGSVSPVNGLLEIRFLANDTSGLAAAMLRLDGNTVEEMVLSGTSADRTFRTAFYTAGSANSYSLAVYDTMGNRQEVSFSLTALTGGNRAPRPHLRVRPSRAMVGAPITLDCSQSFDPDHLLSQVLMEWDLNNDGVFETPAWSATVAITTSFSTGGTRLVRARLTDPAGAQTVSSPIGVRIEANTTDAGEWSLYE